jgi:hypothetical protein
MEDNKFIKIIESNNFFKSNFIISYCFKLRNDKILIIYNDSIILKNIIKSEIKAFNYNKTIEKTENNNFQIAFLNIKDNSFEKIEVQNTKDAPDASIFSNACDFDDYIIFFGGEGLNGFNEYMYILEFKNNIFKWTKNAFPSHLIKRKLFSLSKMHDYCICYGGLTENNTIKDDLFLINKDKFILLNSKEDDIISDDPGKLYAHSSTLINNELFIYGGISLPSEEDYYNLEISNKLYSLNLKTKEWNLILTDGQQPESKAYHSMIKINDDSFIIYGGSSIILSELTFQYNFSDEIKLYSISNKSFYNLDLQIKLNGKFLNSILSDEDENIMLFGGLSSLNDLLANDKDIGLNHIPISEVDIENDYSNIIKNTDTVYLNFKDDKIISKEFSFEYDSPDFDYNEFLAYSDEIISTMKDKVYNFENDNEIINEKINELTNQISQISQTTKETQCKNTLLEEDEEEETEVLRKNTNSMEEYKYVLENSNQLFARIIEKLINKDLQTNIFVNKTVDNAKEYIGLIEQLLSSKIILNYVIK